MCFLEWRHTRLYKPSERARVPTLAIWRQGRFPWGQGLSPCPHPCHCETRRCEYIQSALQAGTCRPELCFPGAGLLDGEGQGAWPSCLVLWSDRGQGAVGLWPWQLL